MTRVLFVNSVVFQVWAVVTLGGFIGAVGSGDPNVFAIMTMLGGALGILLDAALPPTPGVTQGFKLL